MKKLSTYIAIIAFTAGTIIACSGNNESNPDANMEVFCELALGLADQAERPIELYREADLLEAIERVQPSSYDKYDDLEFADTDIEDVIALLRQLDKDCDHPVSVSYTHLTLPTTPYV